MQSFLRHFRGIGQSQTPVSIRLTDRAHPSLIVRSRQQLKSPLAQTIGVGNFSLVLIRAIRHYLPFAIALTMPQIATAYQIPTTTSGTWSGSGTTAAADKSTPGGLKMTVTISGAAMTFGVRNNTALQTTKTITVPALPSTTNGIQVTSTAQSSCVATATTCANLGTLTFTFTDASGGLVKVKNPVIHMSRLGGFLSANSKSALHGSTLTLTTPGVTLGSPTTGSRGFTVSSNAIKADLNSFPTTAATGTSFGDCTAAPAAPQAGCGSIPVTGLTSSLAFNLTMERRNLTANPLPGWIEGSSKAADGIYFTVSFDEDFGDAPSSYDAGNAASHIISDLTLGSSITAENPAIANGGATGTTGLVATSPNAVAANASNNGLNGDGASDDGVTSFPALRTSSTTYSVPVSLAGASRAGQVCGWVDFNKNSTFDTGERACTAFASGATTATLSWSGISGLSVGKTYVRIRASYDTTGVQTPTGRLSSGEVEDYQLNIDGTPDLTITKSHVGSFTRGQTDATYTLTAQNIGTGATSGVVTVTDTLPPAPFLGTAPLSATAISGTGWTCNLGTLTCTRSDALAVGASYPPITLTVDVANPFVGASSATNTAAISGGGQTNTNNDSDSDLTTLVANSADLIIAKTHTANFTPGQVGATYTLTVQNATNTSLGNASAVTTVNDTLPVGLTATAISGTGWTCTLSPLRCTRTGAVAGNTTLPPITVTVNVATTIAQSVTNSATVGSSATESNTTNNSASDPTTIVSSDLTITKSHTGNFSQQQKGATYTLLANNIGNLATSGTVTVTDTLPTGLTATAIAGSGWSCILASLTCSRSDVLAASSSYPPITVTVDVATNASTPLVNNAAVSGGGEVITTNNTAADSTSVTVVATPPVTISGKVWDDANNSANGTFTNINTGAETGTNGDGLYAILVDSSGKTIASSLIANDGTYSFANVSANQSNVKIRLATSAGVSGSSAPDAEIFSDWFNTSPVETAAFNIVTANISGKDFGLEQLPNTSDVFATDSIVNPNGNNQVQVPALIGYDPEDGNLGTGNSFRILSLPANGTLYYNGTVVVAGNLINNYNPTLLKVDPIDGAVTVDFIYAAIDSAGKQSVNPGTASMEFTAGLAEVKVIKRITEINGNRAQNPNDTSFPLNQVLNNPATANDDPGVNWPSGFLVGSYNAGLIKPGDVIEYTVYFLNAQGSDASAVKLCDRIVGSQQFLANAYPGGKDIEYKLGTNVVQYLTQASLSSVDRAELNVSTGAIAGCSAPSITGTNNGTVVIDVTGSGSSGQQDLVALPGATAPGTPTNSYGYFRFKTKVNP